MSEGDECEICKDGTRDTKTLCVVQSTKDVYALEKVKIASDYVTSDIDDDGIYNALKHFNII